MLQRLIELGSLIGNTPMIKIDHSDLDIHAKLEWFNLSGSIKARPAYTILEEAIRTGKINQDTTIVESSSGNFAIALATISKRLGLRFTPVIDAFTNAATEGLLRRFCHDVIKITEMDETGGYLLNRIRKIEQLKEEMPNMFWPNQYSNPLNPLAHNNGTGKEICEAVDRLDVMFIAISSGGSVTGISQRIKKHFPNCKIVAVDAEGSVIFGGPPRTRPIPGMGSSMRPNVLDGAIIDEVCYINEHEVIDSCDKLLNEEGLFVGGSAGGAFAAVLKYDYSTLDVGRPSVAFICPDSGRSYLDNVYNPEWRAKLSKAEMV